MEFGNGFGNFDGLASKNWKADSRPLSQATQALRSFVVGNIISDNKWEIDRITRYYLFQKFYDGLHYRDFNDGLLSFNYIQAFINKVNMFLLGKDAFTFKVESYYNAQVNMQVEKYAEELLMYHWMKSKKTELAYEILQMGSVMGDVWVGVEWNEEHKFCQVRCYDSRQCFVTFENGDYNKVKSFLVRQPLDSTIHLENGEDASNHKYKLFVQEFTPKTITSWYQDDLAIDKNSNHYEETKLDNPYGFIPVVHIKNHPKASGYYGVSDANNILKINKVYNEMMQEVKAIIDYHATPTTIITGAKAGNLRRGLGQIWSGLPPEASVYNLGLDVDLSSTMNFIAQLKTAMHELSDVPETALGKIQPISNTSAAALQITYQPLIEQADMKAITYGEGITQINSMIFKILKIKDPSNIRLVGLETLMPNFLEEARVVPIFATGLPKDKNDELNRSNMELNLGIASRREVMERLGKENIPELLDEIDADKQRQMQVMGNGMQMQQPSNADDFNQNDDSDSASAMSQDFNQ